MKKLQILGTGCAKCEKLARLTEQAAKELEIEFHLEKVTDLNAIVQFGVIMTPALVVDGKVKFSGSVPDLKHLKAMIQNP